MEEKETSLKETLKNINNRLEDLTEKKKVKKFKLPFGARLTSNRVKQNWVGICYIMENKAVRFLKAPIDENVVMIDNIPHVVNSDEILIYKNKPFLIVTSWSIRPFSPRKEILVAKDSGDSTLGWEYIMNYLKKNQIKSIKNIGVMAWIIGLVVLGGIVYYAFKSGWFS